MELDEHGIRFHRNYVRQFTQTIEKFERKLELLRNTKNGEKDDQEKEEGITKKSKRVGLEKSLEKNICRSLIMRGSAYRVLKECENAITDFIRAEEISKKNKFVDDDGMIHLNLGVLYYVRKKFKEAIHHLEIALRLDPKTPSGMYLCNILTFQGKFQRCLVLYNESLKHNPNQTLRILPCRATVYLVLRDYENALADYNESIKLIDSAEEQEDMLVKGHRPYVFRAKFYIKRKMYDLALADANRALEICKTSRNPTHKSVITGRSYALRHKSDAILGLSVKEESWLLEKNMLTESLECVSESVKLDSEYIGGFIARGNVFLRFRRFDDALGCFSKAVKSYELREKKQNTDFSPPNPNDMFLGFERIGKTYMMLSRMEDAKNSFVQHLESVKKRYEYFAENKRKTKIENAQSYIDELNRIVGIGEKLKDDGVRGVLKVMCRGCDAKCYTLISFKTLLCL